MQLSSGSAVWRTPPRRRGRVLVLTYVLRKSAGGYLLLLTGVARTLSQAAQILLQGACDARDAADGARMPAPGGCSIRAPGSALSLCRSGKVVARAWSVDGLGRMAICRVWSGMGILWYIWGGRAIELDDEQDEDEGAGR